MLVVTADAANQTIRLPIGQVMEIRLESNPTTGFRWQLAAPGGHCVAMVGDGFEPKSTVPGQGGEHCWRFEARQPGDCDITLVYRRPWETGAPPARSCTVHVQVTR